jgi:fibronectin-binding autotransporter adhesin
MKTTLFSPRFLPAISLLILSFTATETRAQVISVIKQVNTIEQNQFASPFFTNTAHGATILTNIATSSTPGFFRGNVRAGYASMTTGTGTLTVVGNSTSAGGWIDGNGIPAGVTLTFSVQFTAHTPDEGTYLTTKANSGTGLGDGIGIVQSVEGLGSMEPGETLILSALTLNSVNWSGSPAEPGFTLIPGTLSNMKWNRLRANGFSAGMVATTAEGTFGFGTSSGTLGSNLPIPNLYTGNGSFSTLGTAGPITFTVEQGAWNLKGLGFAYEVTYEMQGEKPTPTWVGLGADNYWGTSANWSVGTVLTNGSALRFGSSSRQTSTNNLIGFLADLITFTNGGFSLFGNAISNNTGIAHLQGNNMIGLDVNLGGTSTRTITLGGGTSLSMRGAMTAHGAGLNVDFIGGGNLTVENGGSLAVDGSAVNSNLRFGLTIGQTNTLNVNAGGTVYIPNAISGSSANRLRLGVTSGAVGVLNINDGGAVISPDAAGNQGRSLLEVGQNSGAIAVVNLNTGGRLHAQRIEANAVGADATFNFNGGLLEAHRIPGSTTYFTQMDRAQVMAGGAIVDTTNSIQFALPLLAHPESSGGGLIKTGVGTLILADNNTYTGPTVVSNGTLLASSPMASTSLVVRQGGTLVLAENNSTWNVNSVTLDQGGTLRIDFGNDGGGIPVNAGALVLNGASTIAVSGTFTSPGSYPIMQYSSISGSGTMTLGARPPGIEARIVTNTAWSTIDMEILSISREIDWAGFVNGDWDIGTTANWSEWGGSTTYNESNGTGDILTFRNGPLTSDILIKQNVRPAMMTFWNSSTPYRFTGAFGIHGPTAVNIGGGGVVSLATSNSFTGGVSNSLGFVELGHNNALGAGLVTLAVSQAGTKVVGLSSDSTTPRTIANMVQLQSRANDELNFQLGDATKSGRLTFTGPIELSNRRNELSVDSDVLVTGPMGNGSFSKAGTGKLTITGPVFITAAEQVIAQGDVVVDGGQWTNGTHGLRLVAMDESVARLIVTNNGIITLQGGSNLRLAGPTTGSFTQGNGTNEFILQSGELNLVGSSGELSIGNAASMSRHGRALLNGGSVVGRGIRGLANAGTTELVLNGVTLRGSPVGDATLANFISGFTNATIGAGGVVIHMDADRIGIVSQSMAGTGGIIKTGDGALYLNGLNSYAGQTVVNRGVLGGSGALAGPVSISALGSLTPGGAAIGTFTINNALTLGGTTVIDVDKAAMSSDQVNGLTAISYGGTLVINNLSATPLAGGEVFQLFMVSGEKNGNFSQIIVLPSNGLAASFNPATGQISINSATPPTIHPPTIVGSDLILTAEGLTPNGTYSILTSPDLAAPMSTWITNTTGIVSGSGFISNAIPIGTQPQGFFRVKTP